MPKFDYIALKKNIKILIKNRNMTQQQLAEVLGMSQSNVSKALNDDEKKCFTVEQLYDIAEHFNVSVDELLGRHTGESTPGGQRGIGAFLAAVLSSGDGKCTRVKVKETVFDPYHAHYGPEIMNREDPENEYWALYFPNYWNPSEEAKSEEEFHQLMAEATAAGNETLNLALNTFLQKYLEILRVYQKGEISKEAYEIVLNDYLSKLKEN